MSCMEVYEACWFFFFDDASSTELYTLSLHDALPISVPTVTLAKAKYPNALVRRNASPACHTPSPLASTHTRTLDRKSTRLNSSHVSISYAVFCLKKKNQPADLHRTQVQAPGRCLPHH